MDQTQLDTALLPYPLPPWKHRFRTLSIFCEADEAALRARVPSPLELVTNVVQIAVMHFESTVPTRPYYDSAVIAQVRYGGETGGHWVHAFTSTDQVCAGTRELWGFRMKLAVMELHIGTTRIRGFAERLGRRVVEIDMRPTGRTFAPLKTFPRLFVKALPEADRAAAVKRQVVLLPAETEITETVWGEGTVAFEPSEDDPTHLLKPGRVLGASLVSGNQVLPWGVVLSA